MLRQEGTEQLPTEYTSVTQLAALLTPSQMSGAHELWMQVFRRLKAPASAQQHKGRALLQGQEVPVELAGQGKLFWDLLAILQGLSGGR